ncbi:hypothetical protein [Streptomyces sp. G-G2]|uniref:hypothetical protein n=1 Tax=Streptomyces sp. G-G2 TaxID=3046201 RepID=UPI0024B8D743|nr:hypothetical protein [Streptomyces sp. G-G2]MDJ0383044.1 hypothetical protein [Streptomyces sp. G-G2]
MRASTRGSSSIARAVAIVADVMAFVIGAWILLYLLDANTGNSLVQFVHDAASWLASWSYDLFTFDRDWVQVVVGYGLAAVAYLFIGHTLAGWLARR